MLDPAWGPLLGTIVGAVSTLIGTTGVQWFQARQQQRQREIDRRFERHEQFERVYRVMLYQATDTAQLSANRSNAQRADRLDPNGEASATFMLMAPAEIREAFIRCRDLWWDYEMGSAEDDGTPEMRQARDDLADLMRGHLDELDGGLARATALASDRNKRELAATPARELAAAKTPDRALAATKPE